LSGCPSVTDSEVNKKFFVAMVLSLIFLVGKFLIPTRLVFT